MNSDQLCELPEAPAFFAPLWNLSWTWASSSSKGEPGHGSGCPAPWCWPCCPTRTSGSHLAHPGPWLKILAGCLCYRRSLRPLSKLRAPGPSPSSCLAQLAGAILLLELLGVSPLILRDQAGAEEAFPRNFQSVAVLDSTPSPETLTSSGRAPALLMLCWKANSQPHVELRREESADPKL